MNKRVCILGVLVALSGYWGLAQTPGNRPLTEADLTRPLDALSSGDPVTRQPMSATEIDLQNMTVNTRKKDRDGKKEEPKKKGNGTTEITAREGLFDQKAHQAIFSMDVTVVNPEFHMTCDKLTAFLKDDTKKKLQPNAPAAEEPKQKDKSGGLERAVAEGSVVITQEKAENDGSVTKNVGRSKKAVFESRTGDITLTGRPEVQTGINSCLALDESTVMVLNRDGRMKVFGPHKVVIKDASSPDLGNAR